VAYVDNAQSEKLGLRLHGNVVVSVVPFVISETFNAATGQIEVVLDSDDEPVPVFDVDFDDITGRVRLELDPTTGAPRPKLLPRQSWAAKNGVRVGDILKEFPLGVPFVAAEEAVNGLGAQRKPYFLKFVRPT